MDHGVVPWEGSYKVWNCVPHGRVVDASHRALSKGGTRQCGSIVPNSARRSVSRDQQHRPHRQLVTSADSPAPARTYCTKAGMELGKTLPSVSGGSDSRSSLSTSELEEGADVSLEAPRTARPW